MNAHNPPDRDDILISSLVYELETNATNPEFNTAAQQEFAHLAMKVFNHRQEVPDECSINKGGKDLVAD
tara:strand:+ start:263 stop:469 length:207 start_codon:yes stop_codon:yes gene_type:complete